MLCFRAASRMAGRPAAGVYVRRYAPCNASCNTWWGAKNVGIDVVLHAEFNFDVHFAWFFRQYGHPESVFWKMCNAHVTLCNAVTLCQAHWRVERCNAWMRSKSRFSVGAFRGRMGRKEHRKWTQRAKLRRFLCFRFKWGLQKKMLYTMYVRVT